MNNPSLFGEEPRPTSDASLSAPIPGASPAGGQTQSLYRKYRPQTFDADELVGQEHIVRTLRNAITLDRVAHAYLFCGPRGTGKTTTARLLAKAVNCLDLDPLNRPCNACTSCRAIASGAATDVIEIDAASNRGIDDIRELRERVKYAPTQLKTKFYIIDEAHQITGAAANAFLKTLEEPPGHTKFVLATTDPEELLPTIVSRCQRFDFRRINADAMIGRLRSVAETEGLTVDDDALRVIARHAAGSLRDGLGLLDQLSVYGDRDSDDALIDADSVRALLGVSRNDRVELLATALADRDVSTALGTVNAAVEAGEDPRQLNRQLVAYLRVLLHQRAGGSPDADETAKQLATRFELNEIAWLARLFSEIDYKIRHSSYAHLPFEVALVDGILQRPDGSVSRPADVQNISVSPSNTQPARQYDAPMRDEDMLARPPTTALRDRVRGTAPRTNQPSVREGNNQASDRAPVEVIQTPAAVSPPVTASAPPRPNGKTRQSVEQLIDLWPRIRLDVKAVNRRIEALLSSIDPVDIRGDEVILAAAYPFHRDRMNSDEVRVVVDDAISRILQRAVKTTCVLRGETPIVGTNGNGTSESAPSIDVQPTSNPEFGSDLAASQASQPSSAAFDIDVDDERIKAAKRIFDADEITQ
jgi:DNA polymerase III subunit gamma/tau